MLQRTGFCFARAAYEVFLLRTRGAADGVMAALIATTVGFGAVTLATAQQGPQRDSHLLVLAAGPGTVIGGALFGVGMALAGMCAAGTLQRVGEGYTLALATLAGIVGGAALDPSWVLGAVPFAGQSASVSLGAELGFPGGFLVTIVGLVVLWQGLARVTTRSRDRDVGSCFRLGPRCSVALPVAGGVVLGLLNAAQMAIAIPWTVGYPLSLVPSLLSGQASQAAIESAVPALALDGGMVLGALAASAASANLRLRRPRRWRDAIPAFVGGVLMGWGITLARGCNVGGVLSAIPSLSVSGWLHLPAMLAGAWIGTRIVSRIR